MKNKIGMSLQGGRYTTFKLKEILSIIDENRTVLALDAHLELKRYMGQYMHGAPYTYNPRHGYKDSGLELRLKQLLLLHKWQGMFKWILKFRVYLFCDVTSVMRLISSGANR